jgi:hypothetical protein
LIVSPHATAVVDNDEDEDNDRCHGGGVGYHAPPPLWSIPSHRMPLIDIVDVAGRGQRRWNEGVQGVVVCVVEEEEIRTIVFDCQVTI